MVCTTLFGSPTFAYIIWKVENMFIVRKLIILMVINIIILQHTHIKTYLPTYYNAIVVDSAILAPLH